MKKVDTILSNKIKKEYVREYVCNTCLNHTTVYNVTHISKNSPLYNKTFEIHEGCICINKKATEELLQQQQAEFLKEKNQRKVQEAMEYLKKHSFFSTFKEYQKYSLSNYIPETDSQKAAFNILSDYLENFDPENPKTYTLFGSTGIGKTHLAVGLAKALTEKGYTAVFINVRRFFHAVRDTYNKDSSLKVSDMFEAIEKADFAVIDELGVEKATDGERRIQYDLVSCRAWSHTLFTTNHDKFKLLEYLGQETLSRVLKDNHLIKVEGPDKRKDSSINRENWVY